MTESSHSTRLLIVGDNQLDTEESIRLPSTPDVQIELAHKFDLRFLMFIKTAMDVSQKIVLMGGLKSGSDDILVKPAKN